MRQVGFHDIGQRVIVRSKDSVTPYWIGTLKGFDDFGGRFYPPITLVEADDGMVKGSVGIVVRWDATLQKTLDTMSPRQQWLFLGGKKFWSGP